MSKVGYKGKVKKGSTAIAGIATWSYSGTVRGMEDDSELGDEHKTFVGVQLEGGEITLTGHYLIDEDAGQQLLRTAILADSPWTDIKLFTDELGNKYYEPDPTTTPASYVSVTKFDEISQDKAGIVTFSATLKVSGIMRCNAMSTQPGVDTIGALDIATITATIVGELTGMGGEGTFDCYFEYGTTSSYGSNTKANETILTAVGLFDNDLTGLTTSTLYHFRAVIEETDTDKHYGKDMTFTTA
jgi:hypothetical protein